MLELNETQVARTVASLSLGYWPIISAREIWKTIFDVALHYLPARQSTLLKELNKLFFEAITLIILIYGTLDRRPDLQSGNLVDFLTIANWALSEEIISDLGKE